MGTLELSIEIAAPPERVAVFFVPQRMAYWYGAEMEAKFEVQGGVSDFAVGQKLRITGQVGGREVSITPVITRHEFGRLLEWRFADAYGVRGRQSWEIDEMPGGTRVTMHDEYEMPGRLGWATDKLITRFAVRQRDREYIARLKRLAEAR